MCLGKFRELKRDQSLSRQCSFTISFTGKSRRRQELCDSHYVVGTEGEFFLFCRMLSSKVQLISFTRSHTTILSVSQKTLLFIDTSAIVQSYDHIPPKIENCLMLFFVRLVLNLTRRFYCSFMCRYCYVCLFFQFRFNCKRIKLSAARAHIAFFVMPTQPNRPSNKIAYFCRLFSMFLFLLR